MSRSELEAALRAYESGRYTKAMSADRVMGILIQAARDHLRVIGSLDQVLPPADNGELHTAEWLAAVGGKYQEYTGAYSFFGEESKHHALLWINIKPGEAMADVILVKDDRVQPWVPVTLRTRGDVRRMCAVFGIPLKEQKPT